MNYKFILTNERARISAVIVTWSTTCQLQIPVSQSNEGKVRLLKQLNCFKRVSYLGGETVTPPSMVKKVKHLQLPCGSASTSAKMGI